MQEIDKIGESIDAASDERNRRKLSEVIAQIDKILEQGTSEEATLHYFRANAFSSKRRLHPQFEDRQFDWIQPELSEEIKSLRRSSQCDGFADLPVLRKCQIFTNLGNTLDTVGRPIDALAAWDDALKVLPNFAMALFARATGLRNYSAAFCDPGHQCVFLSAANEGFSAGRSEDAIWDSDYPDEMHIDFRQRHEQVCRYLERNCDLSRVDQNGFDFGETPYERDFNAWRLKNRLFLNPLNDLGERSVASQDIFQLPNHTYKVGDPVVFPRYFELMCQEYVAAVTLLFEGLDEVDEHAADKRLLKLEHGDYSINSIQSEKKKASFRMAYSILDKCAVFINEYFELGHKPNSQAVSFRSVWYKGRGEKRKLHPKLPMKNWRLRGLFSLSLDLYEDGFKTFASPVAREASDIRNAAEHRFLSVHEHLWPSDDFGVCMPLTSQALDYHALEMLKLARSAIIGISLAVHHQEAHVKDERGELTLSVPAVRRGR